MKGIKDSGGSEVLRRVKVKLIMQDIIFSLILAPIKSGLRGLLPLDYLIQTVCLSAKESA